VFPKLGFWAPNEFTTPGPCTFAPACPGAIGEDRAYPVKYDETGSRVTSVCAEGFTGDYWSVAHCVACLRCSCGGMCH
jgi:hypothetical protein